MPKGKKDKKGHRKLNTFASDDESIQDNASEASAQSDLKSVQDEAEIEAENAEKFEEKLSEAMDGLSAKSGESRAKGLAAMRTLLAKRYSPDAVANFKGTLADHIERSLKKGRGMEQIQAAKLAPLICVQLEDEFIDEFAREVKPALLTIVQDKGSDPKLREESCLALAVISFLAGGDLGDIILLMKVFEGVFSGSYLKGDGSLNTNVSVEVSRLHAEALDAWALLLALLPPADVCLLLGGSTTTFSPSLHQLCSLLAGGSLEVRLSAGEALALVYELGREYDQEFGSAQLDLILEHTRALATDSNKFRAKKDRKTQRATFRDILRYFEEDETPEDSVRVGSERLELDSWLLRLRYAVLAGALGAATQPLAAHSLLLRDALALGPPPAPLLKGDASKPNKLERHLQNAAAFKARTISRAKNRDKRSAVIAN